MRKRPNLCGQSLLHAGISYDPDDSAIASCRRPIISPRGPTFRLAKRPVTCSITRRSNCASTFPPSTFPRLLFGKFTRTAIQNGVRFYGKVNCESWQGLIVWGLCIWGARKVAILPFLSFLLSFFDSKRFDILYWIESTSISHLTNSVYVSPHSCDSCASRQ